MFMDETPDLGNFIADNDYPAPLFWMHIEKPFEVLTYVFTALMWLD